MPIPVKLFAGLKARFGPEIAIEAEPPITASELQTRLAGAGAWITGSRIAINSSFADAEDTICAGDEVAVIPPVSGG